MANFSWCFIGCIDGLKIVLKTQNLKIKDRNVFVTKKKNQIKVPLTAESGLIF